ncbi:hypothetical protein BJX63DRAFT_393097 [Aspergillus granulosus]|uniref:DUF7924 domain-containing protein n=1 Tax=Aspergillus granulosus TaxID=176169 RepID=A0ABR4HFA1_9EURO
MSLKYSEQDQPLRRERLNAKSNCRIRLLHFVISHNHRTVRINTHFSIIDNSAVLAHRHMVREYSLTLRDIRE